MFLHMSFLYRWCVFQVDCVAVWMLRTLAMHSVLLACSDDMRQGLEDAYISNSVAWWLRYFSYWIQLSSITRESLPLCFSVRLLGLRQWCRDGLVMLNIPGCRSLWWVQVNENASHLIKSHWGRKSLQKKRESWSYLRFPKMNKSETWWML